MVVTAQSYRLIQNPKGGPECNIELSLQRSPRYCQRDRINYKSFLVNFIAILTQLGPTFLGCQQEMSWRLQWKIMPNKIVKMITEEDYSLEV